MKMMQLPRYTCASVHRWYAPHPPSPLHWREVHVTLSLRGIWCGCIRKVLPARVHENTIGPTPILLTAASLIIHKQHKSKCTAITICRQGRCLTTKQTLCLLLLPPSDSNNRYSGLPASHSRAMLEILIKTYQKQHSLLKSEKGISEAPSQQKWCVQYLRTNCLLHKTNNLFTYNNSEAMSSK